MPDLRDTLVLANGPWAMQLSANIAELVDGRVALPTVSDAVVEMLEAQHFSVIVVEAGNDTLIDEVVGDICIAAIEQHSFVILVCEDDEGPLNEIFPKDLVDHQDAVTDKAGLLGTIAHLLFAAPA